MRTVGQEASSRVSCTESFPNLSFNAIERAVVNHFRLLWLPTRRMRMMDDVSIWNRAWKPNAGSMLLTTRIRLGLVRTMSLWLIRPIRERRLINFLTVYLVIRINSDNNHSSDASADINSWLPLSVSPIERCRKWRVEPRKQRATLKDLIVPRRLEKRGIILDQKCRGLRVLIGWFKWEKGRDHWSSPELVRICVKVHVYGEGCFVIDTRTWSRALA